MKLFLISMDAGVPKEVTEDFLKLLRKNPKDTNVCFIPTAANHPTIDDWFIKRDRDRLEDMGFKVTDVDLNGESENTLSKKLDDFDMVFVTGGNTFYLLEQVRDSGFDKAIKGFLDKGGIYVGASAGSLVAGLNIEPAGWQHPERNTANLKDLTGMKLVPFVISAHLDDSSIDLIRRCSSKVSYPLIALTDKQAILVDGDKQRIVGVGEKHVFNMSRDSL